MAPPHESTRDLARRIVAIETAAALGSPAALVAGVERIFARLHGQMFPLIGQAGFEAVLARAAHLTRLKSAWLDGIALRFAPLLTFEGLAERLARASAEERQVIEGTELLLANLLDLLTAFIGPRLTMVLVRRIWAAAARENDPGPTEGNES